MSFAFSSFAAIQAKRWRVISCPSSHLYLLDVRVLQHHWSRFWIILHGLNELWTRFYLWWMVSLLLFLVRRAISIVLLFLSIYTAGVKHFELCLTHNIVESACRVASVQIIAFIHAS